MKRFSLNTKFPLLVGTFLSSFLSFAHAGTVPLQFSGLSTCQTLLTGVENLGDSRRSTLMVYTPDQAYRVFSNGELHPLIDPSREHPLTFISPTEAELQRYNVRGGLPDLFLIGNRSSLPINADAGIPLAYVISEADLRLLELTKERVESDLKDLSRSLTVQNVWQVNGRGRMKLPIVWEKGKALAVIGDGSSLDLLEEYLFGIVGEKIQIGIRAIDWDPVVQSSDKLMRVKTLQKLLAIQNHLAITLRTSSAAFKSPDSNARFFKSSIYTAKIFGIILESIRLVNAPEELANEPEGLRGFQSRTLSLFFLDYLSFDPDVPKEFKKMSFNERVNHPALKKLVQLGFRYLDAMSAELVRTGTLNINALSLSLMSLNPAPLLGE